MQCFEVGVVGDKRMKGVQEEEHNKRFLRGEKRGFQGKGKEMMLEWKFVASRRKCLGVLGGELTGLLLGMLLQKDKTK